MRVAVTGNAGPLGPALVAALAAEHEIRWAPTGPPDARPERVTLLEGDPRDRDFAAQLLDGTDALIHLAPLDPAPDPDPHGLHRLDRATRGTHTLLLAAAKAGSGRVILTSSLDLFDRLPAAWRITEAWRPRPEPTPEHLSPYLAELSAREISRVTPLRITCLRFGRIVADADTQGQPFDPRWLHVEDAVEAVTRALGAEPPEGRRNTPWRIYHIAAAGPRARVRVSAASQPPLEYAPRHDFRAFWPPREGEAPAEPAPTWNWEKEIASGEPIPTRPIRRVVFFGSGGPLAAGTARVMAQDYTLRLTDRRPLAEIVAENKPQSAGAPMPELFGPPHEARVVDITDTEQVIEAARGMDAIVNCTVNRPDPVESFRVNTLGAYNVMVAAVRNRIRRVVHTGPQLVVSSSGDYAADYDVGPEAPPRPGDGFYGHTKYLGQEICRVFAEYHALEVPVLLFSAFMAPERLHRGQDLFSFSVSWEDAAAAMRRAVAARSFPSPYELLHIITDLPHDRYTNERAKRLLDWQPRDRLEMSWSVPPEEEASS